MNLLPILQDARNAYESHDRDAFDRALVRIQTRLGAAAATTSPVRHMDPYALERRRSELELSLHEVRGEINRRAEEACAAQTRERQAWERSLQTFPAVIDPSN